MKESFTRFTRWLACALLTLGVAMSSSLRANELCEDVTGLSLVSVSSSDAIIMWGITDTKQVKDPSFVLKVSTTSLAANAIESATDLFLDTTIPSGEILYVLEGLDVNTTYYVYMRSDCSHDYGGTGDWVSLVFKTYCEPTSQLPIQESFASNQLTDCWNKDGNVGFSNSIRSGSTGYSASFSATSTNGAYLISPPIDSDFGNLSITLKAYGASGRTLSVGVMTALGDLSSVERIASFNLSQSWTEYYVALPESYAGTTGLTIVIYAAPSDITTPIYVDDIMIFQEPCKRPSGLAVSDITTDAALLSWDESSKAHAWTISITPEGGSEQLLSANAASYSLSNLTYNTSYTVKLKAQCDNGSESDWSDPVTFVTECPQLVVPLEENFNSYPLNSANYPECWKFPGSKGVGTPSVMINIGMDKGYSATGATGDNALMFKPAAAGINLFAILPPSNNVDLTGYQVRFTYSYQDLSAGNLYFGYVTDIADTTTFHALTPALPRTAIYSAANNAGKYEYEVSLAELPQDAKALAFKYAGVSSKKAGIDNLFIEPLPPCPKPTNIKIDEVGSDQAVFSWHDSGNGNAWNVVVSLNGNEVFNQTVQDTLAVVSGLTSKTAYNYDISVTAVCAEESSVAVSKSGSFSTQCSVYAVEDFHFDFESDDEGWPTSSSAYASALDNCWSMPGASTYDRAWYRTTTKATSGTHSLMKGACYYKSNLVSPAVQINSEGYTLYMNIYRTNICEVYDYYDEYYTDLDEHVKVWISTTPDTLNATQLANISPCYEQAPAQSAEGWYEFEAPITLTGQIYVIITSDQEDSEGSPIYIDDVIIAPTPTCVKPQGVGSSEVGMTSATLTVADSDDSHTSWEVAVILGQDSIKQVFNAKTGVVAGLQSNTVYQTAVRALCGADDASRWVSGNSFRTDCGPLGTNDGYSENFDSYGSIDDLGCWQTSSRVVISSNSSYCYGGSGKCLFFNYTQEWAVMPELVFGTDKAILTFYASFESASSSGNMVVGYADPDDYENTFVPVFTINPETDVNIKNPTQYTVPFIGYDIPEGYVIVFHYDKESSTYWYGAIDQISVQKGSDCPSVKGVSIFDVTSTSATIEWNGEVSDYRVSFFSQNIPWLQLASATPVRTEDVVGDYTLALNDLEPNTTYYVSVQGVCSSDGTLSDFSRLVRLKTECEEKSVPYIESFEANDNQFSCWNVISGSAELSNNAAAGGTQSLFINGEAAILLPRLSGSLADYQLLGDFRSSSAITINLGVIIDPADASSMINLSSISIPGDGEFHSYAAYFSDLASNPQLAPFANAHYITIQVPTGNNIAVNIDNIEVSEAPQCKPATSLIVRDLADTSARITWAANGNSNFLLNIYDQHYAEGVEPVISQAVAGTSYTVEGLTPNTQYYAYVIATCEGDVQAEMSSELSVHTTPTPRQIPFSTSFENDTDNADWFFINTYDSGEQAVNRWTIGSGANNGGSQALYVTNDGTANSYDVGQRAGAWAYLVLNFTQAGNYQVNFDWICGGEGNYDYGLAFLLPTDVQMSARPDTLMLDNNVFASAGSLTAPEDDRIIILNDGARLNGSTSWQTLSESVEISQAGIYYLAFAWKDDYSTGTQPPIAIDNLSINPIVCPSVGEISINNISATSASVMWSAVEGVSGYQYVILNASQSIADVADSDLNFTTETSITFDQLSPITGYVIYVRAQNEAGVSPTWSSVAIFTSCAAMQLPYDQDFESTESLSLPLCWSVIKNPDTQSVYVSTSTSYSHESGKSLYIYSSSNSVASDYILLPDFEGSLNNVSMSLWAASSYSSDLSAQAGYMTNAADTTTFVSVSNITVNSSPTENNIVYGEVPAGATLAIKVNFFDTYTPLYIDDVEVYYAAACTRPGGISVTRESESATFSWTAGGAETSWHIDYNFNQGAVAGSLDVQQAPQFILENLTALTTYSGTFNVRAVCAEGDTSAVRQLQTTFTTRALPPSARAIPYSTGFEQDEDIAFVPNNNDNDGNEVPNQWIFGNAADAVASGSRAMYISNNAATQAYSYNISSSSVAWSTAYFNFDEPGSYALSFDWKAGGEGTSTPWDYMMVMIMPSTVQLGSSSGTAYLDEATVSYSSIPGATVIPNLQVITNGSANFFNFSSGWISFGSEFNITTPGEYQVAFMWRNDGTSGTPPPAAIDNFAISRNSCSRPTALTLSELNADNELSVSWTAGDAETQWALNYAFNAGQATEISGSQIISDNPQFTIEGFQPGNVYSGRVELKAICGEADTSSVISANKSFYIQPLPPAARDLPFATSFEAGEDNAFTLYNADAQGNVSHNHFIVGSAATAVQSGSQALYITDNDATGAHNYDTSTSSGAYAAMHFNAAAGKINIDFDWKGQGETTWDYMMAMLMPADTSIVVSSNTIKVGGQTVAYATIPTNVPGLTVFTGETSGTDRKFNVSSAWKHFSQEVDIDAAGEYKLIFFWRNDGTAGTPPPAAIDNVAITQVTCPAPKTPEISVGNNTVQVAWQPRGQETQWEVSYTLNANSANAVSGSQIVNAPNCTIEGLSMETQYSGSVALRAICAEGDTSVVVSLPSVQFTTLPDCPAPTALVTNVAAESVKLSWTPGLNETSWHVVYSIGNITGDVVINDVPELLIEGLQPLTAYSGNVSVASRCSEQQESAQLTQTLSFKTTAIPADLPFSSGFEASENAAWEFAGSSTNAFMIGDAADAVHSGSQALYISNDGSSYYYSTYSTSASWAYATLNFPVAGDYVVSFDWKANGESTYDYLKAALLPASNELSVSSSGSLQISGTVVSYASVPNIANYFALDSVSSITYKLNGSTSWNSVEKEVSITTPGVYYLAFGWVNDNSTGSQPPAAIDNVYVNKLTCQAPQINVTNITSSTAEVHFTVDTEIMSGVQLALVESGVLPADENYGVVLTQSGDSIFSNLEAGTKYDIYARGICLTGEYSRLAKVTVKPFEPSRLPFYSDFESNESIVAWDIVSGTSTNAFVIGGDANAVNGGQQALYISNDGATYQYTNTSVSASWAYATLQISEAGTYTIAFDWKADGESNYDYLKAFLLPASNEVTISSSNVLNINGSSVSYSSLPQIADYFALDSVGASTYKLNQKSSWQSVVKDIVITNPGLYSLVFGWVNDHSTGNQPPAAIDNVSVTKLSCQAPAIAVTETTSSSITVSYTFNAADMSGLQLALMPEGEEPQPSNFGPVYAASGDTIFTDLMSGIVYDIYARAICLDGEYSRMAHISTMAKEPNTIPFFSDFASAEGKAAWEFANGSFTNQWIFGEDEAGLAPGNSVGLYVSNDGSANAYSVGSAASVWTYAAISMPAGTYDLSFDWKANGEQSATGTEYDYLRALIIPDSYELSGTSDNLYIGSESLATGYSGVAAPTSAGVISLLNGESYVFSKATDWQHFDGSFDIPQSGVFKLAFAWRNDGSSGTQTPAAIGNISLTKQACGGISDFQAQNITTNSAYLSWQSEGDAESYDIVLLTGNESINSVSDGDTRINHTVDPVFAAQGLNAATGYNAYIRINCQEGTSSWKRFSFFTECDVVALPYSENFDNQVAAQQPKCWTLLNNNDVANAALVTAQTQGNALVLRGNTSTSSTGTFYTLLPEFSQQLAGAEFQFSYKMANSYSSAPSLAIGYLTDAADASSFVLIATLDNSTTLNDTVFTLPETMTSADYRLAFQYTPNSTSNYNITIDDISLRCISAVENYNDAICYGYDYQNHGFNIPASQLTAGEHNFTEYRADQGGNCEVRVNLTLNVQQAITAYYKDTVCAGQAYSGYGFEIPAANVATRTYLGTTEPSYLGCDSTTYLQLYVFIEQPEETVEICYGQSITRGDQTFNASGYYNYPTVNSRGCEVQGILHLTVTDAPIVEHQESICLGDIYVDELFTEGYAEAGIYDVEVADAETECVTVHRLNLSTIAPVYHDTLVTVTGAMLPYHFESQQEILVPENNVLNGQTFTAQYTYVSALGCDSIINVRARVDLGEGLINVNSKAITLTPNPIHRGQSVNVNYDFTEQQRRGLRVEVIDMTGKQVTNDIPELYPLQVSGFNVDGLYLVRITTGTGEHFHGRVLVK